MSNQIGLGKYKDQIIETLLKNKGVRLSLSHNEANFMQQPEPDNPSDLTYDTIFPYKHVPEIQEKAKTFITMALQMRWDPKNKNTFRNMDIYIYVFTHQSLQRTDYGMVRTDMLAEDINTQLEGNNCFGLGKMYLADVFEYQMAESEYNGLTLKYSVKITNEVFIRN